MIFLRRNQTWVGVKNNNTKRQIDEIDEFDDTQPHRQRTVSETETEMNAHARV